MNTIYPKLDFKQSVTAGTRKVLGHYFVPPGFAVHSFRGKLSVVGDTAISHVGSVLYNFGLVSFGITDVEDWVTTADALGPTSTEITDHIENECLRRLDIAQSESDLTASAADDDVEDASETTTAKPISRPGGHELQKATGLPDIYHIFKRKQDLSLADGKGIFAIDSTNALKCVPIDSTKIRSRKRVDANRLTVVCAYASVSDSVGANTILPWEDSDEIGAGTSFYGGLLHAWDKFFDDPISELRNVGTSTIEKYKTRMLRAIVNDAGVYPACNLTIGMKLSMGVTDRRSGNLHISS